MRWRPWRRRPKRTPADAHVEDMLAGAIEAMFRGDSESFDVFRGELDRIEPGDDRVAIRFGGELVTEFEPITCGHCGKTWTPKGIMFGHNPGLNLAIHVSSTDCHDACRCWSDLVGWDRYGGETDHYWPRCLACEEPEPSCTCTDAHYGPCVVQTIYEINNPPASSTG